VRGIISFIKRHRRGEVSLLEALSIDVAVALSRRLGLWAAIFGAGVASAAVYSSLTASSVRTVAAPRDVALLTSTQKQLVSAAWRYGPGSGIVYVWGGTSPLGFDCSGYVYFVHHKVGIYSIPRNSRSQWSYGGTDVRKGQERPGDVVFFVGSTTGANAGPPPGHEGLYIGGGKFIEYYSSGRPAHVALLKYAAGYMGAKRWWQPTTVDKRDVHRVFWFARHFHVRISNAQRRVVTFAPWRGRGRIPAWRYRLILRWLNHHPPSRAGGNPHRLKVRFA